MSLSRAASTSTRPTMHDVARAAGVSLKTVSRVVNGEPKVGSETVARVQEAIRALGFRPNDAARGLRTGQTSTVGLVIEDIANPFYSQVARGVEEVAQAHGRVLITASSEENPEGERGLVQALMGRRVDGLILVPAGRDHRYLGPETRRGTPVVFLDRPAGRLEADTVLLDNRAGAKAGVQHLIAKGHRRIAFVTGFNQVYTGAERMAGYREALSEAGLALDEALLRLECHDVESAEAATLELLALPNPPTALFAANNRLALGAAKAAFRHGGLELLGFDDFELADLLPLNLTVIRYDTVELGRQAAKLLFARLNGDEGPPKRVVVPVELVTRSSAR